MTTLTLTRDEVYEALKDVYDPEIPVNVVDLGLIYGVEVEEGNVDVTMTLTFAGCGMGPYIAQQAEWRIAEMDNVEDVNVELTFDPRCWTPAYLPRRKKIGWPGSSLTVRRREPNCEQPLRRIDDGA